MKARITCLLVAVIMAAVGVVATAGPAGAGDSNLLTVNAVVNGTPTAPLVLTRTCTSNPPANAVSPGFTTSQTVFAATPFNNTNVPNTCTIAVTEAGGLVPSFACTTTNATAVTCNPGDDSATALQALLASVVITVTFDPAPPAEATAPAAVEAGPAFTG
jgi:hypothetical protein